MATPTPHDSLVRSIFSQKENALVELRAILPPALFAQLDPESLEHCPGSFVEPDLAQRHTDLLHRCRIAGRDVYVYFLFEHLSGDEPLAAFRLLKYQVNIWQDHTEKHEPALPLPPIIPILLHHSERGWKRLTEFHSLFDPVVFTLDPSLAEFTPSLRFLLDDLSHKSDEELLARAVTQSERVVPVVQWALRDARNAERLTASLITWGHLLAEIMAAPRGIDALARVFQYISLVSDQLSRQTLVQTVERLASPAKELLMTPAQQWIQEGIEKGRTEGKLEGRIEGKLEGERRVLLRMLRLKFGDAPEEVYARVEQGTEEELALWTERILTANSLDEVLEV